VDAEYRTADLQRSAVDIFVSMAKQSSLTPSLRCVTPSLQSCAASLCSFISPVICGVIRKNIKYERRI